MTVDPMSEDDLTAAMAALIRDAFSNLRHQLGRCDDEPRYRYTFSDTDFAVTAGEAAPSNFDPRHRE